MNMQIIKLQTLYTFHLFRNKDNYEVNDAEKGGKENTAFDNESDTNKKDQGSGWKKCQTDIPWCLW